MQTPPQCLAPRLTLVRAAQKTRASFLGVGAPEAFVIGVVALLVFGPKGLAEVRRRFSKGA